MLAYRTINDIHNIDHQMELQTHLDLIKVTGSDAVSFLQGQLTNDLEQANNQWQLSAYCNPKGRSLAVFLVWKFENDVYLITDKSLSDTITKRLRMYILRSDVEITQLQEAQCIASKREVDNFDHTHGELKISDACTSLGFTNFWLHIYFNDIPESTTGNKWKHSLIIAGIPQVNAKTTELFVPQMINLDLLGGINFKKGCYTGQEIVARMHYLGKLKQRMFLLQLKDSASPEKLISDGMKITSSDNKSQGTIVNYINHNKPLLAVLRVDAIDCGHRLFTESGVELSIVEKQPYPLSS